ncbi:hypothetical protein QYE76_050080 [Lolium multiflorum]|uniref:pyruvate decarboxylase n=1 Tax=Lolium multiflorum TaxID=4521 RepID=A0AAD8WHH3_LOLMU|nr:hypothetical protein QYE76_050075 [Lolium multiflorum]KAK1661919.1 hypothetical protein QYE76_050078 [Lolium multiflorum]KAK1661920.1 hypothetical protein QYE76_050079 [Lolium multiflorum]KAK1661921.1 hypothetical protein QYE76_050080 [Lolium multiflorum]
MATALGSLPSASSSATTAPSIPANATLGRHLARRLAEVGARDVFTVPGDFNLTLLDELEAEQPSGGGMRLVGCCNELNAAYAADGYARAGRGVGASNTRRQRDTLCGINQLDIIHPTGVEPGPQRDTIVVTLIPSSTVRID